jgi:hypothetical protein
MTVHFVTMDNSSYTVRDLVNTHTSVPTLLWLKGSDQHTNCDQSYNSEMGGLVSAIAKGLANNIERDFIKQISPSRDKPKAKDARKQEDNLAKKDQKTTTFTFV